MSISLNNHESRIKALENGGAGSWSNGSNANGNWVKESKTGLLIQWGTATDIGNNRESPFKFPIAFSNVSYHLSLGYNGHHNVQPWVSVFQYKNMTTTGATISLTAKQVGIYRWLAIGYLISYRILNYAYVCKSLLFTPLRKQLEV